jgi:hypothetical protein
MGDYRKEGGDTGGFAMGGEAGTPFYVGMGYAHAGVLSHKRWVSIVLRTGKGSRLFYPACSAEILTSALFYGGIDV